MTPCVIGGDWYLDNDELRIYRGKDFVVQKHIRIHQPTLSEICDYGESEYYSMLYQLTSTPQSLKFQLWDMGVDYTEITPYELFYNMLFGLYSVDKTAILFGDLDFQKFKAYKHEDNTVILYQAVLDEDSGVHDEVVIDEYAYNMIMDYIRQSHFIEKDEKLPANNSTKMILIEDARDECLMNKNKEQHHSYLKNLIPSMINSEGFKYNHSQVWDMKINAFMDSVKRISKIKNAELLLQSGYSGFGISLKEIDKKQLDWLGELS